MCSIVGPIMDNRDYYQGDLSDIIRASYGSCSTGTSSSEAIPFSSHHWMFLSDPMDLSRALEDPRGNFGDPFSNSRDPFLHELDMPAGSAYFNSSSGSDEIGSSGGLEEAATCFGGAVIGSSDTCVLAQEIVEDYDVRRPNNIILSSMIQISPIAKLLPVSTCDSPVMPASPLRVVKPSAVISGNMVNTNTSKDHCLVDNTGVQISSPRNPAGLKRRKSQAKKSICVPAPAAPNRQSGEVVPSDLWAWRKYGQKPIKGSPHPRGYYRCSSSKGCPARKQVERSRTDTNMLVITYTSEHNHPWPTQRNALAGSSRSQPSKKINNNTASKNSETSQTTEPHKGTTTKTQEEEQQSNSDSNVSPVVAAGNSANSASVKEENIDGMEKQLEMDDGEFSNGVVSYKTSNKMKCNNQLEDFFAELGEMEADDDDSLNLLCAQGFGAVDDQQRESKVLDPFHVLDWSEDNSTRYYLTRTT